MESNIDIKAQVERAKTQLTAFYSGDSWTTENFSKKVLSVTAEEALMKITGHSHSIAQLVGHMMAWKNFALQKLAGDEDYDIMDDSVVNWPQPANADDWMKLCKEFETCHRDFIGAIDNQQPEQWSKTVPGRNYTFIYLVYGIIEHDYYHYGQIGSLKAAIQNA